MTVLHKGQFAAELCQHKRYRACLQSSLQLLLWRRSRGLKKKDGEKKRKHRTLAQTVNPTAERKSCRCPATCRRRLVALPLLRCRSPLALPERPTLLPGSLYLAFFTAANWYRTFTLLGTSGFFCAK